MRLLLFKGPVESLNHFVDEAALSVFDNLQQSQRDFFDFSFNLNKYRVSGDFLENLSGREENIVRLVSGQKKRHYILLNIPCAYSKNVKGYYESIAIMLKNTGNIVTIAELEGTCIFTGKWNQNCKNMILNRMLSTAEKQDRVYDWGINKYQVCSVEVDGRQMITAGDFLVRLAKEDDNVILLTNSIEGARNAAKGYPLIFLDVVSEWDVQKERLSYYSISEWNEIYSSVDKMITKRELPFGWNQKKVTPFECERSIGADEICFKEERITELSHYMQNEEMLCGMLSVLKAVEEMESEGKDRN